MRNKVQLIGHVGNAPEVREFENGKKVAKFSLATNETYRNAQGDKQVNTQWHNVVAWGKTANLIEQYANKGKELAITGKLTSRMYETKEKQKRIITEIVANEVLLLGTKA